MFKDLSISNRMVVACSVVVLLFSSTFLAVGISLSKLTDDVLMIKAQAAHLPQVNDIITGILGTSRSTMNLMIFGGTVSAVLAAIFGIWIVLGIRRQVGGEPAYAAGIVSRVSEGDLTINVQTKPDDNTSLLFAVRNMVENLTQMCFDIRTNSDSISVATREIAQGNADLSQRTERQAANLEETVSSMAELLSSVHRNADNTSHASKLAQGASTVAKQSGQAVDMLVTTMTSINSSSKKIADIISVIDGIAFQTNILALNAAVEAARAGEQGKGFAVVAAEVRNLAQRSAAAAKEIKHLIGNSVNQVNIGSSQVKEAAESISDVVTSVQLVASMMKDISTATAEQSMNIEQVNTAITEMDDVTQQNAALVEEASAAAEAIKLQANSLLQAASKFKMDENRTTAHAEKQFEVKPVVTQRATTHGPARARVVDRSMNRMAKVKEEKDGDWKEF